MGVQSLYYVQLPIISLTLLCNPRMISLKVLEHRQARRVQVNTSVSCQCDYLCIDKVSPCGTTGLDFSPPASATSYHVNLALFSCRAKYRKFLITTHRE